MTDPDSGLTVLHVDTGRTWRGGQAQIFNLLSHMRTDGITNHLLLPPDSPLIQRFENSHAHPVIHTHPLRGVWDLTAVWTLRSIVREHGVDLIHAHSSGALGITWIGSEFFSFPPFIETRRLETPVAENFLSKRKYASTRLHIANSQTVREVLIESGIDPDRIVVVPSGIDYERIRNTPPDEELVRKLGLIPSKPIVGNVGALCAQKDQATFVRAAQKVLDQHPETQFVIAGEGELRDSLTDLINELGINEQVVLAGFVDEIFGLMKTFDLFVLTSKYEGLCGTILQAMACEVPVLSSDVRGSRQILHHGENCMTVEPGDVQTFANRIRSFLSNPSHYMEMVPRAKDSARQYDYKDLSRRVHGVYRRLLENHVVSV